MAWQINKTANLPSALLSSNLQGGDFYANEAATIENVRSIRHGSKDSATDEWVNTSFSSRRFSTSGNCYGQSLHFDPLHR